MGLVHRAHLTYWSKVVSMVCAWEWEFVVPEEWNDRGVNFGSTARKFPTLDRTAPRGTPTLFLFRSALRFRQGQTSELWIKGTRGFSRGHCTTGPKPRFHSLSIISSASFYRYSTGLGDSPIWLELVRRVRTGASVSSWTTCRLACAIGGCFEELLRFLHRSELRLSSFHGAPI